MKKIVFSILFAATLMGAANVQAQKYALIDMEYILKNIPAYEVANEQLTTITKRWQEEVDKVQKEAQDLYKKFQADLVFLSPEMKTKQETEIVAKEQEAQELKRKYFGTDGELIKKRESLIKPIQDEIYQAVKDISTAKGYSTVVDRASAMSIIYASPQIDISNDVLTKLGFSK
ncbi:outer membrane protein [Candidatus Symbiothrix dinenymphae]|nr:outer membrane protein [Candidatus Symbiothrix dinenymphae]